jgi:hypothetical protein
MTAFVGMRRESVDEGRSRFPPGMTDQKGKSKGKDKGKSGVSLWPLGGVCGDGWLGGQRIVVAVGYFYQVGEGGG